jgi:hypothetical protein
VPGAPTGVVAKPKPRTAKVSWAPPADDGNSPITGYTATAEPGGQGCVSTGTACTITGLENRTTYTVTVTATNALGTGPASTPAQVTPAPKAVAVAKPVAKRSKLVLRICGGSLGSGWSEGSCRFRGWDRGPVSVGFDQETHATEGPLWKPTLPESAKSWWDCPTSTCWGWTNPAALRHR